MAISVTVSVYYTLPNTTILNDYRELLVRAAAHPPNPRHIKARMGHLPTKDGTIVSRRSNRVSQVRLYSGISASNAQQTLLVASSDLGGKVGMGKVATCRSPTVPSTSQAHSQCHGNHDNVIPVGK